MQSFRINQRRLITLLFVLPVLLFISTEGNGQQPVQKYPEKYSPGVTELLLKDPANSDATLMIYLNIIP